MKKVNIITLCFLVASFTSCLKKGAMNIDVVDKTSNIVTLQYINGGSTVNSGLQYFSGSALTYPPSEVSHLVTYSVSVNGPDALNSDLTVSVGVDATKSKDNFSNDGVVYDIMPDSLYHFESTSAVIPAATRAAQLKITFYPAKVDPTKSYILPVTVKDAGGQVISGNFSTIYFHMIGNPLAGVYDVVGTRYNYTGGIGYSGGAYPTNYVSTATSPSPKTAAPNSPTVIALDYANLGGSGYSYLVTYNPATPTVISVAGNSTLLGAVSNFTVFIKTYDPVLKKIHIVTSYNNAAGGSGSDRIIDETFTHR